MVILPSGICKNDCFQYDSGLYNRYFASGGDDGSSTTLNNTYKYTGKPIDKKTLSLTHVLITT